MATAVEVIAEHHALPGYKVAELPKLGITLVQEHSTGYTLAHIQAAELPKAEKFIGKDGF